MKVFVIEPVRKLRTLGWAVVAAVLVAQLGCGGGGPQRSGIHGTVTLDGQPLEQGTVAFIPTGDTQGPTTGAQIANGVYEVPAEKGAVQGMHQVQITSVQKTGKQIEAGSPEPPGTMVDEVTQIIPPQYNTNSTLTIEIQPGSNQGVDFALESASK